MNMQRYFLQAFISAFSEIVFHKLQAYRVQEAKFNALIKKSYLIMFQND